MHCSSCEPLLDDFLEATLSVVRRRAVAQHLRRCPACSAFLKELRVIDALLTTARAPGNVGSDFTETVVSATRSAQLHQVKRVPVWLPLTAYLALAWTAVGFGVTRAGELQSVLGGVTGWAARGFAAIEAALRVLAPATGVAAAAVTGVLLLDLFLFCAMLYGYRRLRPRLALYLARGHRW
jgi:anti-sigma factor RsiW